MHALCEDPAVIGSPFLVMGFAEGRALRLAAAGFDPGAEHVRAVFRPAVRLFRFGAVTPITRMVDAGRIARIVLVSTGLAFLSFSAAVALFV